MTTKSRLITILVLLPTLALAKITLHGQAQVRPRMDLYTFADSLREDVTDFYTQYRLRMDVHADIGDGWFAHSRLGHNGVAYWMKFGEGVASRDYIVPSTARGTMDMLEMYFGYEGELVGGHIGMVPISGVSNPILDLHYYPDRVLDIPFHRYSQNALPGFHGYAQFGPGRLSLGAFIEDNSGSKIGGEQVGQDAFAILLEYRLRLLGFEFSPQFLNTSAADSIAAPMSYGFNLATPRFAGLKPSFNAFWTSQTVEDTLSGVAAYDGYHFRARVEGALGPGCLMFWHDWAKVGDQKARYFWISYRVRLYRSDEGEVTLAPIYRLQTVDDDFTRAKIELDFSVRF